MDSLLLRRQGIIANFEEPEPHVPTQYTVVYHPYAWNREYSVDVSNPYAGRNDTSNSDPDDAAWLEPSTGDRTFATASYWLGDLRTHTDPQIPLGARIDSVYCDVKVSRNSTAIDHITLQLWKNYTSQSHTIVKSKEAKPTVGRQSVYSLTTSAGGWTVQQLNSGVLVYAEAVRSASYPSSEAYAVFYGADLYITYTY